MEAHLDNAIKPSRSSGNNFLHIYTLQRDNVRGKKTKTKNRERMKRAAANSRFGES
jgi:hypothetical protein